ncbi:TrbG/VirB9 family P-type conjugative transfer protein [Sphingomonas agri]|uniref:TrbG/VirB9 family P-type conjugative transfer protein n=1 Tax=Sphingomonas agri TaxID=1813878 RepID=UPI00311EDBA8
MIRKVSIAAFALLGCTSAIAASDNRIRTLTYDPNQIVRIMGKAGIQSTIEFAADERIENVAVGDSAAWQITPNRRASLLFVKPLVGHSRTNMTVVTDRRTYMFDLVAGEKSAAPVYALKFSYPGEKVVQPTGKAGQPVVAAAAPAQAPAITTADKLHFDWSSKGYGKLLPARVFDDGSSLYMAWNRDTPLPAILTQSEDRKEGPVNYRMSGEYIVVSPIPANLVLRYGKKVATLWPNHAIVPVQRQSPAAIAGRLASAPAPAPEISMTSATAAQPAAMQPASEATSARPPSESSRSAVKVANVTSLYSDKLTDRRHEH